MRALNAALRHTATPCQGEPDAWFGDDVPTRREAARVITILNQKAAQAAQEA